MRKTITILLITLMISITGLSQSNKTTRMFGQDIANDAINHTTFCFITSGAITAQMYGWTDRRWLSTFIGFAGSMGIGAAWEQYNKNNGGEFSMRDMKNNAIGAIVGSGSVNLIILGPHEIRNNIRKRREKRKKRRIDRKFVTIN